VAVAAVKPKLTNKSDGRDGGGGCGGGSNAVAVVVVELKKNKLNK
jgi:hypothetical protein